MEALVPRVTTLEKGALQLNRTHAVLFDLLYGLRGQLGSIHAQLTDLTGGSGQERVAVADEGKAVAHVTLVQMLAEMEGLKEGIASRHEALKVHVDESITGAATQLARLETNVASLRMASQSCLDNVEALRTATQPCLDGICAAIATTAMAATSPASAIQLGKSPGLRQAEASEAPRMVSRPGCDSLSGSVPVIAMAALTPSCGSPWLASSPLLSLRQQRRESCPLSASDVGLGLRMGEQIPPPRQHQLSPRHASKIRFNSARARSVLVLGGTATPSLCSGELSPWMPGREARWGLPPAC